MKTKLLKQLRKRFHWYRTHNLCWSYYDKEKKIDVYAYVHSFYYVNDMLIYRMLSQMGMEDRFVKLRDRIDARVKKREALKRKLKFAKYFK
jgi:hypothetical protein